METTKAKFTDAEAHCNRQVQNGHLASILDEQTNKFIAHLAGEKNLWVGGKRDGGIGSNIFTWIDGSGTTVAYNNW